MKIKSIGSNKTELELKDLRLLISYETPVALIRIKQARVFGTSTKDSALKTNKYFSRTTSKHINQWLRDNGFNPEQVPTMAQEFFNEFLEDNA